MNPSNWPRRIASEFFRAVFRTIGKRRAHIAARIRICKARGHNDTAFNDGRRVELRELARTLAKQRDELLGQRRKAR